MIIYTSKTSPFGRKVRIAASVVGLRGTQEKFLAPNAFVETLRDLNPLGKVPVLALDDGTALFDSRVILEFFDEYAGGGMLMPKDSTLCFDTLREQCMADGILDAALLQVYENRYRAEGVRASRWLTHQSEKIERTLTRFEQSPPKLFVGAGAIALACALGYLDLRFGGVWRARYYRLVGWLEEFSAVTPSFGATRPCVDE